MKGKRGKGMGRRRGGGDQQPAEGLSQSFSTLFAAFIRPKLAPQGTCPHRPLPHKMPPKIGFDVFCPRHWPPGPLLLLVLALTPPILSNPFPPSPPPSCPSNLLVRLPWPLLDKGHSLLLEYSPPRGFPPSPFILAPSSPQSPFLLVPINGTWPSVGYSIRVDSIGQNGTRKAILRQIAYSSPGKPILVSIAASDRTCTLAYSSPAEPYARRQHFSFHLEYFSVDGPGTVFFVRTNSTSVRLRRLQPGTQYRLSLFAEFFSVRSLCPLELTFRTKIAAPQRPIESQKNASQNAKIGGNEKEEKEMEGEGDEEERKDAGKGQGGGIRMGQSDGKMLALSWDLPELVPCDAFLVSHNASGQSAQRTSSPGAQIPLRMGKLIEVNIACLFENTLSSQWSAHRLIDLRRPSPIRSIRLIESFTDEFFRSWVILGVSLPPAPSFAFRLYQLQIGWAPGKKVVGHQSRLFPWEEISFQGAEGRVNISGLEPARLYTFSVRNVSRELGGLLSSAPIGLRLTTPPIITSTLDAGKIGTDSINVNFGESDPEHPFDHYELRFGAHSANESEKGEEGAIRKLGKQDAKSLTFGKLVPGKTYRFSLFTTLQGVHSRPVTALITTYPLKVSSLRPLLGPRFVLLFWTVQNPAQNECRFRLSYTASAGPHLHRAVSIELNGTTLSHRFGGLDWNTFYTFTITVIMGPKGAEAESESESVTVGMAAKPRSIPLLQRYGSRELLLTFHNDRDAFSDRNGVVSQFAVIVAQQTEGTAEEVGDVWELPGWHDVRERAGGEEEGEQSCWDAFRASPSDYNPFKRKNPPTSAQFLIGSEDCAAERRRLDEPFCNGPLRAQTEYWVKVRAYTVAGIGMETGWVGVNGNVPLSAGAKADGEGAEEQEKRRRFPCYLYLNGCSNGAGALPAKMLLIVPFLTTIFGGINRRI